jgi:hypothetical protein
MRYWSWCHWGSAPCRQSTRSVMVTAGSSSRDLTLCNGEEDEGGIMSNWAARLSGKPATKDHMLLLCVLDHFFCWQFRALANWVYQEVAMHGSICGQCSFFVGVCSLLLLPWCLHISPTVIGMCPKQSKYTGHLKGRRGNDRAAVSSTTL